MEKENSLAPLETLKAQIESELLRIEKEINRLTQIIDDSEEEIFSYVEQIIKCQYCGTQLLETNVCTSCGGTN
jgi:argininosuccinate lyase